MRRDQVVFNTVGLSLASLLAYALFRNLSAAFIVGLAPSIGVMWTLGVMGALGGQITIMNSIIPLMLLVIGYTDAVHLMLHVQRKLTSGETRLAASRSAVRQLWRPCAMTSLTTALAFGSLVISPAYAVREFGYVCAFGCLLNFIAVLTTVPLLAAGPLGRNLEVAGLADHARADDWCRRLAYFSRRHSVFIVAIGVAITLISALACLQVRPDNRLQYNLPKENAAYQAFHRVEERFGGVLTIDVLVERSVDRTSTPPPLFDILQDVHLVLDGAPHVSHPLSLLNVVQSLADDPENLSSGARLLSRLPDSILHRFYQPATHRALVTARVPDCGSKQLSVVFDDIDRQFAKLRERYPNVQIDLTGPTVVGTRVFNIVVRDLGYSLLAASVIIGILMMLSFGSPGLGIISVVPNAFALFTVVALTVIFRQPFQYISVVVLTICLGISVDDTIHLLARYKTSEDVSHSVRTVGLAVLITSAVFLIGFGSVFFSGIPVLRVFSMLACASLVLALIGDLVLLPALLVFFKQYVRAVDSNKSDRE